MDVIMHWNDFFAVIAVITGLCTFILACRYAALDGEGHYNSVSARKLITAFLIVFTLAAAFALGIK